MSAPPAPPILLASTSPQRRAILHQLGIPFDVVAPRLRGARPARRRPGRARPAARAGQGATRSPPRPAAGRCSASTRRSSAAGASTARPATEEARRRCSTRSAARTHEVVSGLCLITPGWEELETETTRVTFRPLTARDIAAYVAVGRVARAAPARTRSRASARALVERDRGRLPERRRPPGRAARPPAGGRASPATTASATRCTSA